MKLKLPLLSHQTNRRSFLKSQFTIGVAAFTTGMVIPQACSSPGKPVGLSDSSTEALRKYYPAKMTLATISSTKQATSIPSGQEPFVRGFTGFEEVEQSRYGGILGCLMGGEFLDGGCHVIGLIQEQFFVSCFECSPTFFRKPATLQTYEIDSADCVGIACENHEGRYVLWYGRHAAHHAVFAYAGKLMHG